MSEPIEGPLGSVVKDSVIVNENPAPPVRLHVGLDEVGKRFAVLKDGYGVHEIDGPREGHPGHVMDDVDQFGELLSRAVEPGHVLVSDREIRAIYPIDHPNATQIKCTLSRDGLFNVLTNLAEAKEVRQRVFWGKLKAAESRIVGAADLIAKVQSLEAATGSTYSSVLSDAGNTIRAAITGGGQLKTTFPTSFTYEGPVFIEAPDQSISVEFQLFVNEIEEGSPPSFSIECPLLATYLREARGQLVAGLRPMLGAGWFVGLGQGQHSARPVPIDPSEAGLEGGA